MGWRLPPIASQIARSALPTWRSAFVGRGGDVRALADAFAGRTRLVTLVGPCGIGKTRLAVEVARTLREGTPEQALAFADLTDARGPDAMAIRIADALGLVPAFRRASREVQIAQALRGRGAFLLLVDHADHVRVELGALLTRCLGHAHELNVLVTAREKLGVAAEAVHELGPMTQPSLDVRLEDAEAVAFWIDRVRQTEPRYDLLRGEAAAVTRLVKDLEGLPLAIELVAPRALAIAPVTLVRQLSRFDAPGRAAERGAGRQALPKALEWAWSSLEPWGQAALGQCTVFRGGFLASEGEHVLDLRATAGAPEPAAALQILRERALLIERPTMSDGAPARLEVTAPARDVATAHLGRGAEAHGAAARHAAHYVREAAAWAEEIERTGSPEAQLRLIAERENLVAVVERHTRGGSEAEEARAIETAIGALLALTALAPTRTLTREYRRGLDAAIADPAFDGLSDAMRASALLARGVMRTVEGDDSAGACNDLQTALALAQKAGDRTLEGRVQRNLGVTRLAMSDLAGADDDLQRALVLLREVGDRRSEGRCLMNLGRVHRHRGAVDLARVDHETALEVMRSIGDRHFEAVALTAVAVLALEEGELAEARAHYEEALPMLDRFGLDHDRAMTVGGLAGIAHLEGRLEDARALYERAMTIFRHGGDRASEGAFMGYVGLIDFEEGDLASAAGRLEQARDLLDDRLYAPLFSGYLAAVRAAGDRVDEAEGGFAEAEQILTEASAPLLRWAVHVQRGQLDLARARKAANPEEAAEHVASARRRIGVPDGGADEGPGAPTADALKRSADARMSWRILERAIEAHERTVAPR